MRPNSSTGAIAPPKTFRGGKHGKRNLWSVWLVSATLTVTPIVSHKNPNMERDKGGQMQLKFPVYGLSEA